MCISVARIIFKMYTYNMSLLFKKRKINIFCIFFFIQSCYLLSLLLVVCVCLCVCTLIVVGIVRIHLNGKSFRHCFNIHRTNNIYMIDIVNETPTLRTTKMNEKNNNNNNSNQEWRQRWWRRIDVSKLKFPKEYFLLYIKSVLIAHFIATENACMFEWISARNRSRFEASRVKSQE